MASIFCFIFLIGKKIASHRFWTDNIWYHESSWTFFLHLLAILVNSTSITKCQRLNSLLTKIFISHSPRDWNLPSKCQQICCLIWVGTFPASKMAPSYLSLYRRGELALFGYSTGMLIWNPHELITSQHMKLEDANIQTIVLNTSVSLIISSLLIILLIWLFFTSLLVYEFFISCRYYLQISFPLQIRLFSS